MAAKRDRDSDVKEVKDKAATETSSIRAETSLNALFLERKRAMLASENAILKRDAANAAEEIAALKSDAANKAKENADLKGQVESQRLASAKCASELLNKVTELGLARQSEQSLREKGSSDERAMAALRREKAELEQRLEADSQQSIGLRASNAAMRQEVAQGIEKLASAQARVKDLQLAVTELRAKALAERKARDLLEKDASAWRTLQESASESVARAEADEERFIAVGDGGELVDADELVCEDFDQL